jgi:hypothetical protein
MKFTTTIIVFVPKVALTKVTSYENIKPHRKMYKWWLQTSKFRLTSIELKRKDSSGRYNYRKIAASISTSV